VRLFLLVLGVSAVLHTDRKIAGGILHPDHGGCHRRTDQGEEIVNVLSSAIRSGNFHDELLQMSMVAAPAVPASAMTVTNSFQPQLRQNVTSPVSATVILKVLVSQ
jgi:hypothetical protein